MGAHDVIHLFTKFRCAHAQCVGNSTNKRKIIRALFLLCRTKLKTKIPNSWPHSIQFFCLCVCASSLMPYVLDFHVVNWICRFNFRGEWIWKMTSSIRGTIVCQLNIFASAQFTNYHISAMVHRFFFGWTLHEYVLCIWINCRYTQIWILFNEYNWINSNWYCVNKPQSN